MAGISTLDRDGRVTWGDHFPPPFPLEALSDPIWCYASGNEHRERLKQEFAVAVVAREVRHVRPSLVSPVDGLTYDFEATYIGVDAAVACMWERLVAVKLLTERERSIIRLSLADKDVPTIAKELDCSEQTAYNDWASIRLKMCKDTNLGAVNEAMETGEVERPVRRARFRP